MSKPSEHHGPWWAPQIVSVLVLCLILYLSLNFALREHSRDQHLCRPQRKVEVKNELQSYTCSNDISHTFNPCGDVTMLYLLSMEDLMYNTYHFNTSATSQ